MQFVYHPDRILPVDSRDPFNFGTGTYTPEQAAAALAHAQANPIPQRIGPGGGPGGGWYGASVELYRGFYAGDVRIAEQDGKPTNPGNRTASVSTYGVTIPISIGKRRLGGNVIDASALVARLIGTRKYTVDYEIPITDGNQESVGVNLDCGGSTDSSGNPCSNASGGPCGDTKSAPCPPDDDGGGPTILPFSCEGTDGQFVEGDMVETSPGSNEWVITWTRNDYGTSQCAVGTTDTRTGDPLTWANELCEYCGVPLIG